MFHFPISFFLLLVQSFHLSFGNWRSITFFAFRGSKKNRKKEQGRGNLVQKGPNKGVSPLVKVIKVLVIEITIVSLVNAIIYKLTVVISLRL